MAPASPPRSYANSSPRSALTGVPDLGEVDFSHPDFPDGADFINVDFTGSNSNFYLASFAGLACFNGSQFTRGGVNFHDTAFSEAAFLGVIVNGTATFVGSRFSGDARIEHVPCRHVLALSTARFGGGCLYVFRQDRDAVYGVVWGGYAARVTVGV
ncbi:hypothetical protein, partial [Streptomyces collinus]|uniref:hypothetical protein n=1 Tax=Streptomyces collinus TaxID=42684 RepID=UPI0036EECB44